MEDLSRSPILQKKKSHVAIELRIYGEFHFNADHYTDTRVLRKKKIPSPINRF